MKIAVLADTHIPRRAKDLPAAAYALLNGVDAIVHAGDVVTQEFLERLKKIAPVYAVLGNNDLGMNLPEKLELSWEGVRLGIIHDSGDRKGRHQRLRKMFPETDLVVFGHSHIPLIEEQAGLTIFNPGSATDRRRQAKHTMGFLQLKQGKFEAQIVELD
jgi:putative phosphoesterase